MIWKDSNPKANATSSGNASTDKRHSRAAQPDVVSAPSGGNAATDEMVIPDTGVAPAFPVENSNAPQGLIQPPIPDNTSDSQGIRHSGMATEDVHLPAAGATPVLPVGRMNAPQHAPNPGNALDAAESNHSIALTEEAASSRAKLSSGCVEQMTRRRWADIGRNLELEIVMEDAEEDAGDGPSIGDEEEAYSAEDINEHDMWNLMNSAAPGKETSGISLEDKMGEQFMREAGNSLSYKLLMFFANPLVRFTNSLRG